MPGSLIIAHPPLFALKSPYRFGYFANNSGTRPPGRTGPSPQQFLPSLSIGAAPLISIQNAWLCPRNKVSGLRFRQSSPAGSVEAHAPASDPLQGLVLKASEILYCFPGTRLQKNDNELASCSPKLNADPFLTTFSS